MEDKGLVTGYEPDEVESKWYEYWEESGLFQANTASDKPAFSIVIPPPNITGSLHMGHALNNTLQDVLCRYKRMKGYNVLWQPGTERRKGPSKKGLQSPRAAVAACSADDMPHLGGRVSRSHLRTQLGGPPSGAHKIPMAA
jgi:hypothetical protein